MNALAEIIATPFGLGGSSGVAGAFGPFEPEPQRHFGRSIKVDKIKFTQPPPDYSAPPQGYVPHGSNASSRCDSVDVTHVCCEDGTCTVGNCETCMLTCVQKGGEMRSSSPKISKPESTVGMTPILHKSNHKNRCHVNRKNSKYFK